MVNMFVKPWNDEAENIFRRISTFCRARTTNMRFVKEFTNQPEINHLCNIGLLSISNSRRKHESWFNIPEDVFVRPKNTKRGIVFEFNRFKF